MQRMALCSPAIGLLALILPLLAALVRRIQQAQLLLSFAERAQGLAAGAQSGLDCRNGWGFGADALRQ